MPFSLLTHISLAGCCAISVQYITRQTCDIQFRHLKLKGWYWQDTFGPNQERASSFLERLVCPSVMHHNPKEMARGLLLFYVRIEEQQCIVRDISDRYPMDFGLIPTYVRYKPFRRPVLIQMLPYKQSH